MLLCGTLIARGEAAAQGSASEIATGECCIELLLPIGGRAAALGGALTSLPSGDGVWGNPAELAPLDSTEFLIHHITGLLPTTLESAQSPGGGQSNAFSLLVAAHGVGTFGASYLLVDYGDIASTDVNGQQIGSLSLRTHVFVASFATALAPSLAVGINYSVYAFRPSCSGQCGNQQIAGTTQTVDLGVRYAPGPRPGFALGAAIAHLGLPLQINNAAQADQPPTRLRVGGAFELLRHFHADEILALWLHAALLARAGRDASVVPSVGAELSAGNSIFLRAGYAGGSGLISGASVGVGLDYQRYTMALAKSFSSGLGSEQPVQVTFAIRF